MQTTKIYSFILVLSLLTVNSFSNCYGQNSLYISFGNTHYYSYNNTYKLSSSSTYGGVPPSNTKEYVSIIGSYSIGLYHQTTINSKISLKSQLAFFNRKFYAGKETFADANGASIISADIITSENIVSLGAMPKLSISSKFNIGIGLNGQFLIDSKNNIGVNIAVDNSGTIGPKRYRNRYYKSAVLTVPFEISYISAKKISLTLRYEQSVTNRIKSAYADKYFYGMTCFEIGYKIWSK